MYSTNLAKQNASTYKDTPYPYKVPTVAKNSCMNIIEMAVICNSILSLFENAYWVQLSIENSSAGVCSMLSVSSSNLRAKKESANRVKVVPVREQLMPWVIDKWSATKLRAMGVKLTQITSKSLIYTIFIQLTKEAIA